MMDRRRFLSVGAGLAGAAAGGTLIGCARATKGDKRVFDSHCHIIDPRYPTVANQGYVPPDFTIAQYEAQATPLDIVSGAVVSGSFHGFDQTYLIATLKQMGPSWVGVAQVPEDISDAEISRLSKAGVRALRFNLFRGRVDSVDAIVSLAERVHAVAGWHAEIYADAANLKPHLGRLTKLPQLVIDHLGMNEAGLPVLLELVDAGAKVKATGFGRVSMDVPAALERVAQRNANALMFGTDLPSTRAKRPFSPADLTLIERVLGHDNARKALWDNAVGLYRPSIKRA